MTHRNLSKKNATIERIARFLPYIGFCAIIFLIIKGTITSTISENTLLESIEQQEALRNILWINLITQRATVLTLSPYVNKDQSASKKAFDIIQSMQRFIRSSDSKTFKDHVFLQQSVSQVQDLFGSFEQGSSKNLDRLLAGTERIGTTLNEKESTSWYALLEKNKLLLAEIRSSRQETYWGYVLFVFLTAIIALVLYRKKTTEHRLREAEIKLLSASKMSTLGEMAGGVAHEINNPLATIKCLSSQLNELLSEGNAEKSLLLDMTSLIEKTVDRIAKIIQGLRAFSRDAGHDAFVDVNADNLIEETISLCREKFRNHGIQLIVQNDPGHLVFEGRETEISQVLLNLLNNSYDAIIDLKEKWVKISVLDQKEAIEFVVTDSGAGIAEDVIKNIFQPFFTTKEVGKGTGLGLSISLGIVKVHGGDLTLNSSCANTQFILRLPKKRSVLQKAAA